MATVGNGDGDEDKKLQDLDKKYRARWVCKPRRPGEVWIYTGIKVKRKGSGTE